MSRTPLSSSSSLSPSQPGYWSSSSSQFHHSCVPKLVSRCPTQSWSQKAATGASRASSLPERSDTLSVPPWTPTIAPPRIQPGSGLILPEYCVYCSMSSAGVSPERIWPLIREENTSTCTLSSSRRSNEEYSYFSRKSERISLV